MDKQPEIITPEHRGQFPNTEHEPVDLRDSGTRETAEITGNAYSDSSDIHNPASAEKSNNVSEQPEASPVGSPAREQAVSVEPKVKKSLQERLEDGKPVEDPAALLEEVLNQSGNLE